MCIQALSEQRLVEREPVEDPANAVNTQAPEGTLAVLVDQLKESAQLLCSSGVELQLASFPARPGVGRHLEQPGRLGLGEGAECPVAGRPGPDLCGWSALYVTFGVVNLFGTT